MPAWLQKCQARSDYARRDNGPGVREVDASVLTRLATSVVFLCLAIVPATEDVTLRACAAQITTSW